MIVRLRPRPTVELRRRATVNNCIIQSASTIFILLTILSSLSHSQQPDIYNDVDSFKAIRTLHTKLDDDGDGEVDDSESKKFVESDKIKVNDNNAGAYSTAHKLRYLHQDGKDRSISVDELWEAWKSSTVYNWTTDETVYWLVNHVELPEYSHLFEQHSINGTLLPRLATESQFISRLGITDPAAKSKISIKAMDVVLFGPPKLGNAGKARDIIVSIITLIAISSCYVFYSRSRASQMALQATQDKLESLQKAEDQMSELQQELNKALKAQQAVATEKKNLEHQLEMQRQFSASNLIDTEKPNNGNGSKQSSSNQESNAPEVKHDSHILKLENELKALRKELEETYSAMTAKKFRAPLQLRSLLQTAYNIESQYYNEKKLSLELKATEVKLRNQRLQKKKTSFLGLYKMAQENSLEEDINTIVEVKEAIMQVTREVKERAERWKAIEEYCGCSLELAPLVRGLGHGDAISQTSGSVSSKQSNPKSSGLQSMGSSMSSSKSHAD